MALTISWLITNRVILVINEGVVNREQVLRSSAIIEDMLERSPHEKIHIISDVSHMQENPDLNTMRQQSWIQHRKLGWLVISGKVSEDLRLLLTVAGKATRAKFTFVNTVEQGLEFLHERDQSLTEEN